MKAIWLEDRTLTIRRDLPVPEPSTEEALIRVRLAGICATDLELVKGYYPFTGIPGHEFIGVVENAPSNSSWVGQRVVGEINITCGECLNCKQGRSTHCSNRRVIGIKDAHGAFSEFLTVPLKNLHLVPESVSDDSAVFTEPLAAALEILSQVHIRPSDRVLVIGAGRLGQLIASVISLIPCKLRVLYRYKSQRNLLEKQNIATSNENEIPAQQMDVVIESTGSPEGFEIARQSIRPRGIIVLKSTYTGPNPLNLSGIVVDEVVVMGSRCGPFTPALDLLENHRIDPTPLISARYSLEESLQAFSHATEPGTFKVIIDMDDGGDFANV